MGARGGRAGGRGYTRAMDIDPELQRILIAARSMLARAATDPDDDLHWPVLASVAAGPGGGTAPDARTVVLRHCTPDARRLEVHSDAQAGKIAQLSANPQACLVGYHRARRTQLRLWGRAGIHQGDALAAARWSALPVHSRGIYGEDASRFAVLAVDVLRIDWLLLDPAGHQRAAFDWSDGTLRAGWLAA